MSPKRGFAPVAFDELTWQEDLRALAGGGPRIAAETRRRLEREGQAVDALFACDEEARDGTRLPGCVKVYLPPPGGPLGMCSNWRRTPRGASTSTTSPPASAIDLPGPPSPRSMGSPTAG